MMHYIFHHLCWAPREKSQARETKFACKYSLQARSGDGCRSGFKFAVPQRMPAGSAMEIAASAQSLPTTRDSPKTAFSID